MSHDSPHRFCVAPMLDLTDRHARHFLRLLSRRARLYTEMITTGALLYGDAERALRFGPSEHPVAIQLGGSDPAELARCATLAAEAGYDEVNLNAGCPSDRVQSGRFGACLMAEPERVADCVAAMAAAAGVPVTVKTRIGIDQDEPPERLHRLVAAVRDAGCRTIIVHARNAWLRGLSPKENREIPPLRYEVVHALRARFPGLEFVLNGGLENLTQAETHLPFVDGVMLGRAAYHDPWLLAEVDARLFGDRFSPPSREAVVREYLDYVQAEAAKGTPFPLLVRPLIGLYQGQPGARAWRRSASDAAALRACGRAAIESALEKVEAARGSAEARNRLAA